MDDTVPPTTAEAAPDATLMQRLDGLLAAVDAATKQVGLLPQQIRGLGAKVEGLTTSVSDARLRALLLGVLSVYDLADQMYRTAGSNGSTDHRNNYEVLRTQLRQLLASNGLEEIGTANGFDPQMHRSVRAVPCSDPGQSKQILEVVRAGFRTDQAVLRYAEVVVGQYESPAE
jgi:molecular chaperone GrpE (heat shock protein)